MKFGSKIYWSWLLVSLFFLYQYILRLAPGVMCEPIRNAFGMSAQEFSLLGAYYQYAYAFMQIPIGILLDRMGVRKIILAAIVLCLLGTLLMTHAQTILVAQLSRILVGIGSASAFMGAFKIIVDEVPKGKQGFLMGTTITLGTIGAFAGAKLLVWLMEMFGWRGGLDLVNSLGVVLFIGCFFCIHKGHAPSHAIEPNGHFWKSLFTVLKKRNVWLYAFLAMGMYGPVSALSDLWGTSFLMTKFHLPIAEAAWFATLIYLGMACGGLVIPWFSEKYNIINSSIRWYSLLLTVLFSALIYFNLTAGFVVMACLLGLGIFSGAEIICFAGVARGTTSQDSGVTLGVVNSLDMLGGAVIQQGIGSLLDKFWTGGASAAGVKIYTLTNYQWALTLLVIIPFFCWILSFLLPKDTAFKTIHQ